MGKRSECLATGLYDHHRSRALAGGNRGVWTDIRLWRRWFKESPRWSAIRRWHGNRGSQFPCLAFPMRTGPGGEALVHSDRRIHLVLRSVSRPLTILGAERKLFFFAMCVGAGTFNLLGSLRGGLLMFLLLYVLARWATHTDPQILRLLLASARLRSQYDPMKFAPVTVRRSPLA